VRKREKKRKRGRDNIFLSGSAAAALKDLINFASSKKDKKGNLIGSNQMTTQKRILIRLKDT